MNSTIKSPLLNTLREIEYWAIKRYAQQQDTMSLMLQAKDQRQQHLIAIVAMLHIPAEMRYQNMAPMEEKVMRFYHRHLSQFLQQKGLLAA